MTDIPAAPTCNGGPITVTRTYRITDCSNNYIDVVQTINVSDVTDPTASNPADINVQCYSSIPAADVAVVTDEADNCDPAPVVTLLTDIPAAPTCNGGPITVTRTYRITDCSNNYIDVVQTINVSDVTGPTATTPANLALQCIDDVPVADPAVITDEDDNCEGPVAVTVADLNNGGSGCPASPYIVTRTFTLEDCSGNKTYLVQTITVIDNTVPTWNNPLTLPANAVYNVSGSDCEVTIPFVKPLASDNCDANVVVTATAVNNLTGPVLIFDIGAYFQGEFPLGINTVTITATDDCGNFITHVYTYTINDIVAPEMTCPPTLTAICDVSEVPAPFANGAAGAFAFEMAGGILFDNCTVNRSTFKLVSNTEDGLTCPKTWSRVYEIKDKSGNVDQCTQLVIVDDNIAPTFTFSPANTTVQCGPPSTPTMTCTTSGTMSGKDNAPTSVFSWNLSCATLPITDVNITTWTGSSNCPSWYSFTLIINGTNVFPNLCRTQLLAFDMAPYAPITSVVIDFEDEDNYAAGDAVSITYAAQIIATGTASYPTDPQFTGIATASDNCAAGVSVTYNDVEDLSGCGGYTGTITRTWTAEDACGNTTDHVQVITIEDTTDPVLAGIPANTTVQCSAIPAPATPTATDICDAGVVITLNEVISNVICENSYTITRTWTATDACGNTDVESQVITVIDTQKPVLVGVPADVTVQCDAVPTAATPTATDNCDNDVTITYGEVRTNGSCPDSYTLTRTWIATDNCGNTDTKVQVITVEDTTDPVLAGVPANVTVECNAIPAPAAPTASDNCDASVEITYNEVRTDGTCVDSYTLTRTWVATDNCGNTDTEFQVITVEDSTDPVLAGVPANVTVECNAIPAPAAPTASDNCDASVEITYNEVRTDGTCVDSYTLTRTWVATDNCGNTDTEVQVITVEDTTDPVLAGIPANITVECNAIPTAASPTATDNCDANVAISYSEVRADGACEDSYTLTRTWIATDNCGNTDTEVQVITVEDTTDPVLAGVPANVTVECNAIPVPATPTATDNCDANVAITFDEVSTQNADMIPGNCDDNSYTITRTWVATDNCSNTDTKVQVITVEDTTDPTWTTTAGELDRTVECSNPTGLAGAQSLFPVATDNCDADVTNIVKTPGAYIAGTLCPQAGTYTNTWVVTDACGNTSATYTQVITIVDTTIPTWNNPAALPVSVTYPVSGSDCEITVPFVKPTASDLCDGNVTVTATAVNAVTGPIVIFDVFTFFQGEFPVGTNNVTISATDDCGNVLNHYFTITVVDPIPPQMQCPPTLVGICDVSEVPVPFANGASGALAFIAATGILSDNCILDMSTFRLVSNIDNGLTCPKTYSRLYEIKDASGNIATCTQLVVIDDNINPVLVGVPANVTVECDAVPVAPTVTATDNCNAGVTVAYAEVRTDGLCEDSYTLTRTWTATDFCGNTDVKSQVITVEDTTDPVLSDAPAAITVECSAIPAASAMTATDNCDANVTIDLVESISNVICDNSYTLTRTWTATDNCGNTDVKVQVITVIDTTDPVLGTAPADVTVECDDVPTAPVLTATDNCDTNVDVAYSEVRTDGTCEDSYTLTRTWTATDNCGNTDVKVQVITVIDTTDPVLFGVPASTTVECHEVPVLPTVTATDNCDAAVNVDFNEMRLDGACEDSYTLIRTWTATDNCGNTDIRSQVITVQDITDPVLTGVPADVTVECHQVPAVAAVTASDNCDTNVDILFSEVRADGVCPNTYVLTRTWTATDNCGNDAVGVQIITVEDNIAPDLTACTNSLDLIYECSGVAGNEAAADAWDAANIAYLQSCATDLCGAVTVTSNYSFANLSDGCGETGTMIVTYTVKDLCDNTSTKEGIFTVEDTTDPVPVCKNITVYLDATGNTSITPADVDNGSSDVCGGVSLAIDISAFNCSDIGPNNVTLTATDDCSNSASCVAVVTVLDNMGPFLTCPPDEFLTQASPVTCFTAYSKTLPTITDNCSLPDDIDVTATCILLENGDNIPLILTYLGGGIYNIQAQFGLPIGSNQITITATDEHGQVSTCSYVVDIDDIWAPIISCPANVVVNAPTGACFAQAFWNDPTISDFCASDYTLTSNYVSGTTFAVPGVYTVTYTVTDGSGNSNSCSFTVTMVGTCIPPSTDIRVRWQVPFNGSFVPGQTKDAVIRLNEIGGLATNGTIQVFIPRIAGYTLDFDETQTVATNPNVAVGNSTDGWSSFTYPNGAILLTTNNSIPANGEFKVAIKLTATSSMNSSILKSILIPGSGGDNNAVNNSANINITTL
ncbi:MAG: HYR domain-containing protein [Saprospiraceae bacterium]|nr:HYR domain-containing protein [Saprospiraceae bacterium]